MITRLISFVKENNDVNYGVLAVLFDRTSSCNNGLDAAQSEVPQNKLLLKQSFLHQDMPALLLFLALSCLYLDVFALRGFDTHVMAPPASYYPRVSSMQNGTLVACAETPQIGKLHQISWFTSHNGG